MMNANDTWKKISYYADCTARYHLARFGNENPEQVVNKLNKLEDEIKTMLRQQQAEIEALKKQNHDIYENGAKVIDGCDKKIEELIGELHELQVRYDKLWDEAKELTK